MNPGVTPSALERIKLLKSKLPIIHISFIILILLLSAMVIQSHIKGSEYAREISNLKQQLENSSQMPAENEVVRNDDLISSFLFTFDEERASVGVCGYDSEEVKSNLLLSSPREMNLKYGKGVWSNDCAAYVYSVQLAQPVVHIERATEDLIGIWKYDPVRKTNTQLFSSPESNPYPEVYRFITPNLLSAAGVVIDLKNTQVVESVVLPGNYGGPVSRVDWVKYRNPKFPWMFMHPRSWKVENKEAEIAEDGDIKKLVFVTKYGKINVYAMLPNIEAESYSIQQNYPTNQCRFMQLRHAPKQYDPHEAYLLIEGDNCPEAITLTQMTAPGMSVYLTNEFKDVINSFEALQQE